jgi:hypothetical protein
MIRAGISQSTAFPTVYSRQHALMQSRAKTEHELFLTQNNIKGQVKQQYFDILALRKKKDC